MPPPHAPSTHRGTHQPADHHDHNSRSSPPAVSVFSTPSTRQPTTPHNSARRYSHPAFRESKHPRLARTHQQPEQDQQPGSHPHTTTYP